jgi:hypothetical protein
VSFLHFARSLHLPILAVIACLGGTQPASAHTRSESRSAWQIAGNEARMTFTASERELMRLGSANTPPDDRQLASYLLDHVTVTAGNPTCSPVHPPRPLAAGHGFRRMELRYKCPAPPQRINVNVFFTEVPTHHHIAHVEAGSAFAEAILGAEDHVIDLDKLGKGEIASAGLLTFITMGIMHIFTGVDHMSFLLGLVLISRRFRDLAFVITGFTLGHSVTLALAVTGLLRPHAEFIDALVAFTIALIGIENAAVLSGRTILLAGLTAGGLALMAALAALGTGILPVSLLIGAALFSGCYLILSQRIGDAARLRLSVTLVFGLIHGFGFAADLLNERIPAAKLAELLFGFNFGVELGQLTVVSLAIGIAMLISRTRLAMPRQVVAQLGAAVLIGLGLYWFVQRSFDPLA